MNGTRAAVVLQARMGSSRLPGKAMARVGDRTILAHCLVRLRASPAAPPVILATTTDPADDVLADEAERLGVTVFRGSRDDVLERFARVVERWNLEYLVRATADNPAVDIEAAARTLTHLIAHRQDHVVEGGLPVGTAVEAVRASAILAADALATDPYDREHVTPFIRTRPEFATSRPPAPACLARPDLRFTIDTAEDLEYMRRVFGRLTPGERPAPLVDIIAAAEHLARKERVA